MKLTKAQLLALSKAERSGDVVGYGQHAKTIQILRDADLLTSNKDNWGYFNITPAGRAALAQGSGE